MKKTKEQKGISIFPTLDTREELMAQAMRFHGTERVVAITMVMTAIQTMDKIHGLS